MKKLYTVFGILLTMLLIVSCNSNDDSPVFIEDDVIGEELEEKIFQGNAFLTSQEVVAAFAKENYTQIAGYLCLGARCGNFGSDRSNTQVDEDKLAVINDISPLSSLHTISKGIVIYETDLKSLDGLENVEGPMELLVLEFNESLLEIDALQKITEISEVVLIEENRSLQNLDGLQGITTIGESLEIVYNISLTNIQGLGNLTSVSSIVIDVNSSLTSLAGLEKITALQYLDIRDNSLLPSLEGLNNLTSVSQEFTISDNKFLSDFCALNFLFTNDGYSADEEDYKVEDNSYNPSLQELKEGNCQQ